MKFTILIILAVVLNLVASSLRRSHRQTKEELKIAKDACKTLCSSKSAGFFSFSGLIGHLFINAHQGQAGCMCFDNQTPKYSHHWDKDSQKFIHDPKYDQHMEAYYQKLKKDTQIVEHIL